MSKSPESNPLPSAEIKVSPEQIDVVFSLIKEHVRVLHDAGVRLVATDEGLYIDKSASVVSDYRLAPDMTWAHGYSDAMDILVPHDDGTSWLAIAFAEVEIEDTSEGSPPAFSS